MNLIQCFLKNSTWYKGAKRKSVPVGVLWHDTAAGNPTLKRYVQPHESDANYAEMMELLGKNKYGNDWNHIDHDAGLNAWIGQLADGKIATIQAGDWDIHPWGCGGGDLGSCNGYVKKNGKTTWVDQHWIQFEICDDGYESEEYFKIAYREAVEFTAFICKKYGIDPKGTVEFNGVQVPTILCHADSYKLKLGCNHGDVYKWFKKFGYTMDNVRDDVAKLLAGGTVTVPVETPSTDIAIKAGDLVSIRDGATYWSGASIPTWVKNQNWYVLQVGSNGRAVIDKSENGKSSIMSPIDVKYLRLVGQEEVVEDDPPVETTPTTPPPEEKPPVVENPVPDTSETSTGDDFEDNLDGEIVSTFVKLLRLIYNFFAKLFKKQQ